MKTKIITVVNAARYDKRKKIESLTSKEKSDHYLKQLDKRFLDLESLLYNDLFDLYLMVEYDDKNKDLKEKIIKRLDSLFLDDILNGGDLIK